MKFLQYLKETKNELKEVTFPTSKLTITFTILVIVISVIVAFVLSGADFGLRQLLQVILNR